jgi:hypothetical protein
LDTVQFQQTFERIKNEMGRVVVGQEELVEGVLVAVLAAAGRAGAFARSGTAYAASAMAAVPPAVVPAAAAVALEDGDGLGAVAQTDAVAAGWGARGATAIMAMMLTAATENPANAVEAAGTDLRKLIAVPSCS